MNEATTSPLVAQLTATIEVIVTNGWCDRPRLERAVTVAATVPDPVPTAGRSRVAQFLIDQRVLTREQAMDLDTLMRSQANLPGFRLLRKIGSGGMGVVYLATHTASGRRCALKTLNTRLAKEEDFINRFHREAEVLIGVKHPNIAEVIESGECDGSCYLAMEYIEGPSAMDLLRENTALPEAYSLRIVRQVAEGLAYVYDHSQLVHRDIKPENILIVRGPRTGEKFGSQDVAKLIDFGLVKSMTEDDQRLTQTGMTIGTPLYMSPEQVRGESLDGRSDIYGLGATLYHLLTGATPFLGSSPGAIMSAHLTEAIPDPVLRVPSLSPATRVICMTAMAKNPNERFMTYEALVNACNEAISDLTGSSDAAPKLLLKPMVLKNQRKPETNRVGRPGASATPSAGSKAEITSRIIAKHKQNQTGDGAEPRRPITLPELPVMYTAPTPVAAPAPAQPGSSEPPDLASQSPREAAPAAATTPPAAETTLREEPVEALRVAAPVHPTAYLPANSRPVPPPEERAPRRPAAPPPRVVTNDPDMEAEAKAAARQAHRVGWIPLIVLGVAALLLIVYVIGWLL